MYSGDYDLAAGLKSIFHSIRILDFACQIASSEKILVYDNYTWLLRELWKLSESYSYEGLWNVINTRYLETYKQLKSKLKALCPKENTDHFQEKQILRDIFKKYNITTPRMEEMIKEILTAQ